MQIDKEENIYYMHILIVYIFVCAMAGAWSGGWAFFEDNKNIFGKGEKW